MLLREARTPGAQRNQPDRLMDPFVAGVVFILMIVSGVWGSMVLAALLKRFSRKLESRADDPLIEELRQDTHQLEARLDRVEEELSFFRELHEPESPVQLPSPDPNDS